MQIKITQKVQGGVIRKKSVVLGPLKRESERINTNGDVINPKTKQIIKPAEQN
jgi:hypothetical protein